MKNMYCKRKRKKLKTNLAEERGEERQENEDRNSLNLKSFVI